MTLSEKLMALRQKQGLSQLELAEALHVSRQAISRWESDQAVPSIDNLKYLSDLYGVSVDYLLSTRAEDFVKKEDTIQKPQEEKSQKSKKLSYKKIAVLAAVVLLVIVLAVSAYMNHSKENERKSLSIGSMSGEEVDSIPKTSFTIEW